MDAMNDMTDAAASPDDTGAAPDTSLPEETAEAPTSGGNEQCVPLDALAMPDEGEQMTPPAEGDPVSYTVEGKVTRVTGNMAYVKVETINGKPAESEAAPDAAASDADQFKQLSDAAEKQGYLG